MGGASMKRELKTMKGGIIALALAGILIFSMACSYHNRTAGSVMSFLYPNAKAAPKPEPVTTLRLPVVVGIAFVPVSQQDGRGELDEASRMQILESVKAAFLDQKDLASRIEVVPSSYLQPGGGFDNLSQVQTMFGTDVICLLGYDQFQSTSENHASFLYLTIIGSFLVPGNTNETRTMMEATVYDVSSRRLLFRAPGISIIKNRSTGIGTEASLQKGGREGFEQASKDMVKNLQQALQTFKSEVKNRQDIVVQRKDSSGRWVGGSWGVVELLMAALLGLAALSAKWRLCG
jgi:rhombotail lipoprotein